MLIISQRQQYLQFIGIFDSSFAGKRFAKKERKSKKERERVKKGIKLFLDFFSK